jgi:hypothetical protein
MKAITEEGDEKLTNLKKLTNAYLYQLAQTDINSKTYAEIESFLKEIIWSCSREDDQTLIDKVKAVLINKLSNVQGVDKVSILDESGYQLETLGLKANGAGPVTVLIIDEGK